MINAPVVEFLACCCEGAGLALVLGWSSSASTASSLASTPATACESRDPHLDFGPPP